MSPALNLQMVELLNTQSIIRNAKYNELNIGDVNTFYNKLFNKASAANIEFGTLNGVCAYLSITKMQYYAINDFTNIVMINRIIFLDNDNDKNTASLCNMQDIVGSVGRCIGAKGTINTCIDKYIGHCTHDMKMKYDAN